MIPRCVLIRRKAQRGWQDSTVRSGRHDSARAPQSVTQPCSSRLAGLIPVRAAAPHRAARQRFDAQIRRLGFPPPASDRSEPILNLWIGTWIAAFAVGFLVWGLILWAANRYKTKHAKMPRQNRYNLPMEIFYTIAPFIIIAVLFYYTVLAQNAVTAKIAEP